MKKSIPIFLILFITACSLFEDKANPDTTDPIINLTIAGGNEISRGVTLYIDIEGDGKIESVSIMIDDTTAYIVEEDFEVIRFDVTPFADESEHILYAIAEDSEGNIGESDKLDIVITEFPGWRIYKDINLFAYGWWAPVVVDDNGIVWAGSEWGYNGVYMIDPINDTREHISSDNNDLPWGLGVDIAILTDSRAWIAGDRFIAQYDYNLKKFHKIVELPDTCEADIYGIAVDNDYNVWMGTYGSGVYKYDGENVEKIGDDINHNYIWDITVGLDNTMYLSTGNGVYSIKDGIITQHIPWEDYYWGKLTYITTDPSGNIWVTEEGYAYSVFDGTTWNEIPHSDIHYTPLCFTKDGLMYTQAYHRGLVVHNGNDWLYFDELDSPFNEKYFTGSIHNYERQYSSIGITRNGIAEAPNGDIWVIAGGLLMRYRPSLGVYKIE